MTLIVNQSELCPICGRSATAVAENGDAFQSHHVIPRSMGGDLVIRICTPCHNLTESGGDDRIHITVIWSPEPGIPSRFKVVKFFTGETVTERPAFMVHDEHGKPLEPMPEWWNASTFIAELHNSPQHLRALAGKFWLLDDAQLVSAGEALGKLGNTAWELRGRLFHLALSRSPWGRKEALLLDVARQFGLELREARNEAAIAGWLENHPDISAKFAELDENLPPREAMKVIMKAQDPEGAVDLWQEQFAGQRGTKTFESLVLYGREPDYCEHNVCPGCGKEFPKHERKQ